MPELPEVEVVCRGLEPLLQGKRLRGVQTFRQGLRYDFPDFDLLEGLRLQGITRRSKYILMVFGEHLEQQTLVWHLGMTGQFHVLDEAVEAAKHEHVRFDFEEGVSLRYRDARRFGYAGIFSGNTWQTSPWFTSLGPEPLSDAFSGQYLYEISRSRMMPVKSFIMKADVVVGVGNIYASESLFQAAIHPKRAAGHISKQRMDALVACIRHTLAVAIEAGGSSISDFVKVDGKPGYFAHTFQVYGREGEACYRCKGHIRRIVQSGRSTFYCPQCQR